MQYFTLSLRYRDLNTSLYQCTNKIQDEIESKMMMLKY